MIRSTRGDSAGGNAWLIAAARMVVHTPLICTCQFCVLLRTGAKNKVEHSYELFSKENLVRTEALMLLRSSSGNLSDRLLVSNHGYSAKVINLQILYRPHTA